MFEGGPEGELWQTALPCGEGRFALANPPQAGRLLFFAGPREPFPFHRLEGVLPGGAPLEVAIEQHRPAWGGVEVGLSVPEGGIPEEAQVLLVGIGSGRAVALRPREGGGRHVSGPVPPGRYRVQLGAAGLGFRDLGEFDVLPGKVTDLGVVALPAPGALALEADRSMAGTLEGFLLLRAAQGCESLVLGGDVLPPQGPILVPAGEYSLRLYSAKEGERRLELRVEAGQTTRVSLGNVPEAR